MLRASTPFSLPCARKEQKTCECTFQRIRINKHGEQMNSGTWFELRFRDNSYKKYVIKISDIASMNDGSQVSIRILQNEILIARFKIEFTGTWISINCGSRTLDKKHIGNDEYSPLIANLVKDFIFGKKIEELNDKNICIHTESEYAKSIFKNENEILNYQRDPTIVAKENRFAREIVLRELYTLHTGRGPSSFKLIVEKCNFYEQTIHNAIETLKDRQFIQPSNSDTLKLSYSGLVFVEDKLLSPFNDKIFLVAACDEMIYKLTDEVYKPAVNQLGYELIFQERSEPKGTIHDDIWEYLEHSKLILCDLTLQRPNCFIEYGYALAIRKTYHSLCRRK